MTTSEWLWLSITGRRILDPAEFRAIHRVRSMVHMIIFFLLTNWSAIQKRNPPARARKPSAPDNPYRILSSGRNNLLCSVFFVSYIYPPLELIYSQKKEFFLKEI